LRGGSSKDGIIVVGESCLHKYNSASQESGPWELAFCEIGKDDVQSARHNNSFYSSTYHVYHMSQARELFFDIYVISALSLLFPMHPRDHFGLNGLSLILKSTIPNGKSRGLSSCAHRMEWAFVEVQVSVEDHSCSLPKSVSRHRKVT
jgi:hypothetical protein